MNDPPRLDRSLLEESGIQTDDNEKAEKELDRRVFIGQRAAAIHTLVKTHTVAIFSMQTALLTLFIAYAVLIDNTWFNWFEMIQFLSWLAAVAVITTDKDILTAARNLMYVCFLVFIFDALTIGFRSSEMSKGYKSKNERDRQIALLVHTIYMGIISLSYVGIVVVIRAKYPRGEGKEREPGTPAKVYNEDINTAYALHDVDTLVQFSEIGMLVVKTRQARSQEEVQLTAPEAMFGKGYDIGGSGYEFEMPTTLSRYGNTRASQIPPAGRFQSSGYAPQNMRPAPGGTITYTFPAKSFGY